MIGYVATLAYALMAYAATLVAALVEGSNLGCLLVAASAGAAYLFQLLQLEPGPDRRFDTVLMFASWFLLVAAWFVIGA